jgi:microcystin-dependent protein
MTSISLADLTSVVGPAVAAAVADTHQRAAADGLTVRLLTGQVTIGSSDVFGDTTAEDLDLVAVLMDGDQDPMAIEYLGEPPDVDDRVLVAFAPGGRATVLGSYAIEGKVNTPVVPLGGVITYFGTVEPPGNIWRFPNGQALDRILFQQMFAMIGTKYGAGDGTTTFNLPDLRDRTPWMSTNPASIGGVGGEKTHVLTPAEMPFHNHVVRYNGVSNTIGIKYGPSTEGYQVGSTGTNATFSNAVAEAEGGNDPHNNMPPYMLCNRLIRVS